MRGDVYWWGTGRIWVVGEKYTTQDVETYSQAKSVPNLRAYRLYDVVREARRNEFEMCCAVDFFQQRA